MNPFLLWVPGVALIVLGALLFATETLGMTAALVVIGIGVVTESAGIVLWLRDRSRKGLRPR
jgi:general stress protein CsbA